MFKLSQRKQGHGCREIEYKGNKQNNKINNKMVDLNPNISIIILNTNGLKTQKHFFKTNIQNGLEHK